MSNHKSYGNQNARSGKEPSAYSSLAVCDIRPPLADAYDRLLEIAEGLMRKGYDEDYAFDKAAEQLDKRDELF